MQSFTRVQHVRMSCAINNWLLTYRKYDHVTPLLRDWHWLPVEQRIKFKVAVTVYKCLRGLSRLPVGHHAAVDGISNQPAPRMSPNTGINGIKGIRL